MAWFRLLRIAALPSALSNILLGFLIANASWTPLLELTMLLLASASFYSGGMVFNDVMDLERDRETRPERPLPSGEISRRAAIMVSTLLFGIGLSLACAVAFVVGNPKPLVIGVALTLSIFLYDGPLKRTVLAPWMMGACRFLNILLGASVASAPDGLLGIPRIAWWLAMSIGVLIAGTTWLASRENKKSTPGELLPAGATILLGIGLYFLTCVFRDFPIEDRPRRVFPFFAVLIALPLVRRLFFAIGNGTPATVQQAVVTIIRSLIILDAAAVWLVAKDQVVYPLVVLSLLIPSFLLGRISKVT